MFPIPIVNSVQKCHPHSILSNCTWRPVDSQYPCENEAWLEQVRFSERVIPLVNVPEEEIFYSRLMKGVCSASVFLRTDLSRHKVEGQLTGRASRDAQEKLGILRICPGVGAAV